MPSESQSPVPIEGPNGRLNRRPCERGRRTAVLLVIFLGSVAAGSWAGEPVKPEHELVEGRPFAGIFEGTTGGPGVSDPGQPSHRFQLPPGIDGLPWRLVVMQQGIDVKVVEIRAGQEVGSLNFHLDRFEEEVFRLDPSIRQIEIRPVIGGERTGSYQLQLELPLAETQERRQLELRLTEAARIEHGAETAEIRRAAQLYEAIASELDRHDDVKIKGRALLGAANHRRVLGEGERAAALYSSAGRIWRQLDEPAWQAAAWVGLGQSLRRLGRLAEARKVLEEALELWHSLPGRETEIAQTESSLGLVAHVDGDLPRALHHYRRALERHQEDDRQLEIANVSLNMGSVLARLGDANGALDRQRASLEIFRRLGDRRGELDALNSLATLYRRVSDLEEALELYGQSRDLAAQLGDRRLEGRALNNRGWVYLELGQFERAIADLEPARRFSVESGDTRIEIAALEHLAEARNNLGHYDQARRHWHEALDRAKASNNRRQMEILAQLGRLEARLGTGDGEDELAAAWALHEQRGNAWEAALLHTAHGEARNLRGAAAEAIEPFHQARQTWRFLDNQAGEILALTGLGRAQRTLGRLAAARSTLEQAIELIESQRLEMTNPNLRAAFLSSRLDAHELLIETLIDLAAEQPDSDHLATALEVSERARGRRLLDLVRGPDSATAAQDPETAAVVEQRRRQARDLRLLIRRHELVQLGRQRAIDGEDLQVAISDARARLDILDARIRRHRPRRSALTAQSRLRVDEMRHLLDQQTALIHYFVGRERSHLWLLDHRGLRHQVLADREQIAAAARRAHTAWSQVGGSREQDAEAARELSRMILSPLVSELPQTRLVVVPDGALHYVPFGALPALGNDPRPLIERFEIVRLSSLAVVAAERSQTPPTVSENRVKLAILADPVFDPGDPRLGPGQNIEAPIAETRGAPKNLREVAVFGRLPGSAGEARAIAAHLPAAQRRVSLGFDAHRAALIHSLENSSIAHIATHGIGNTDDPELSGLVLAQFHANGRRRSDGFLHVYDLHHLELAAELVVLSGCRTGLGQELRGEALQGLMSGFLFAGGRRVIASLWAVADRATAQLMDDFYRALLVDGLAPAAALRRAQLKMAGSRNYSNPYYWRHL